MQNFIQIFGAVFKKWTINIKNGTKIGGFPPFATHLRAVSEIFKDCPTDQPTDHGRTRVITKDPLGKPRVQNLQKCFLRE